MSTQKRAVCSVLIVGAGPVGLSLALLLARHGLRADVIDARGAPSGDSRATAIHTRTLEVLGPTIADRLVGRGQPFVAGEIFDGAGALGSVRLDETPSRYPFALGLSQAVTESVLRDALAEFGVAVEWGTRVSGLAQRGEGCAVTTVTGGRTELREATWVVGCDGALSTVRELAGIRRMHAPNLRWWHLADAHLNGDVPPASHARVFLGNKGVLAMLPLERAGWRRLIALGGPVVDGEDRPELTAADYERLLADRTPLRVNIVEHGWLSTFRIHEHVVDRYREGRVFLAGDAAHAHSPLGGQGMNTGIQDAANLAWKLASVIQGVGSERLLDSYDAERRPVAETLVATTARGTRVVYSDRRSVVWLRNGILRLLLSSRTVRDRARQALTMLAVSYPSSPIVEGRGPTIVAGDRGPVQVPGLLEQLETGDHLILLGHRMSAVAPGLKRRIADPKITTLAFEAMGLDAQHIVVLRPDGHVGWIGTDVAALEMWFNLVLG